MFSVCDRCAEERLLDALTVIVRCEQTAAQSCTGQRRGLRAPDRLVIKSRCASASNTASDGNNLDDLNTYWYSVCACVRASVLAKVLLGLFLQVPKGLGWA